MNRKDKSEKHQPKAPSSTHPEAEAGVRILSPALRAARHRNQPLKPTESRTPIVSIHGRDVGKIPDAA